MSAKATAGNWDPLLLPIFIAACATPWAGGLFERWFPYAVAGGIGMFVAWTLVGFAVSCKPPIPNWSLLQWTAGGAFGAFVSGGVIFLLGK